MNIGHFIPYLSRDFGGPVVALSTMVNSLNSRGHCVSVCSVENSHDGNRIDIEEGVALSIGKDSIGGAFRYSRNLWRAAQEVDFQVIHSHGLWTDVHRMAATLAREKNVPHLLAPCGMLLKQALSHSAYKKKVAYQLFQKRCLNAATCLLANSAFELEEMRAFGISNPIAMIPNPVAKGRAGRIDDTRFVEMKSAQGKKKILFLGRLHPVKGLEKLIQAWSQMTAFHVGWSLILAGPGEDHYKSKLVHLIDELQCSDSIVFTGVVDDHEKWGLLESADLFVMPSDFESFGLSIVEAMTMGVPVITTEGTPWKELQEEKAGWWVAPSKEAIFDALHSALNMEEAQRKTMGANAKLMSAAYSAESVADQLEVLYSWLLGETSQPDFVF